MNNISVISKPIENELNEFKTLFSQSLLHTDGLLNEALTHILNRGGKMMRPMLVLLIARNYGNISSATQNGAIGLELLHTASLVHDDVVDESLERRGQPSTNAIYNNKISILVGDYILSTALYYVAKTQNNRMVEYLANLGSILSQGEINQLSNISNRNLTEEDYFRVIRQKTAALFAACAKVGALSANATDKEISEAEKFGETLGIIFQIKDDIFDYYESEELGKPTGNDMLEGKLTLPVIHALLSTGNNEMMQLAEKVKSRNITTAEIQKLIDFTKENHGIDYACEKMDSLKLEAQGYIKNCKKDDIRNSLAAYLDFIISRDK